jgi:hypothetical protein
MSWAKVDDHANEFHKQLAAGPEACWFWVCGLMYANRQRERDGFIPEGVISMLYPVKSPKRLAKKLVEVGLWDEAHGGYQIHNYHGWNPTPEQVEAERAAGRERAAKSYAKKHPKKPESSPEEKPKTTGEDEPKKTDSSGSTPLHSDSKPEEQQQLAEVLDTESVDLSEERPIPLAFQLHPAAVVTMSKTLGCSEDVIRVSAARTLAIQVP